MATAAYKGLFQDDSDYSDRTTYDKIIPGDSDFCTDSVDLVRDQHPRRPYHLGLFSRHRGMATKPAQPWYTHYEETKSIFVSRAGVIVCFVLLCVAQLLPPLIRGNRTLCDMIAAEGISTLTVGRHSKHPVLLWNKFLFLGFSHSTSFELGLAPI